MCTGWIDGYAYNFLLTGHFRIYLRQRRLRRYFLVMRVFVCLSRIPAKNNQPISLKQPKFNGSRALSVGGGMLCQSAVYSYCLFMSPQPILQRRHYVFALSVAALFPPFVPCQTYITNFTAHISFASQEY